MPPHPSARWPTRHGRALHRRGDEPRTGLHIEDVREPLRVLHEVIEADYRATAGRNLDVIGAADRMIGFRPEGGDGRGRIVATGAPEDVAPSRRQP